MGKAPVQNTTETKNATAPNATANNTTSNNTTANNATPKNATATNTTATNTTESATKKNLLDRATDKMKETFDIFGNKKSSAFTKFSYFVMFAITALML